MFLSCLTVLAPEVKHWWSGSPHGGLGEHGHRPDFVRQFVRDGQMREP